MSMLTTLSLMTALMVSRPLMLHLSEFTITTHCRLGKVDSLFPIIHLLSFDMGGWVVEMGRYRI